MTALSTFEVHHIILSVFTAVLLLGTGLAKELALHTPFVLTPPGVDVDHTFFRVRRAELLLLAAIYTESWLLDTSFVAAGLNHAAPEVGLGPLGEAGTQTRKQIGGGGALAPGSAAPPSRFRSGQAPGRGAGRWLPWLSRARTHLAHLLPPHPPAQLAAGGTLTQTNRGDTVEAIKSGDAADLATDGG